MCGAMVHGSKALLQFASVAGIGCLVAVGVTLARRPTAERITLARYSASACVPSSRAAGKSSWNTALSLGGKESVQVLATGEMRSMFELAFSDEEHRRQVTTFWDYSYPRDARISRSTNTLWLLVTGGLGGGGAIATLLGLSDRARLYEYDLGTRTIAHEHELEVESLPASCP